jgi:hypothetical protein
MLKDRLKRLKDANKPVFNGCKYTAIAGLLYWIYVA